MTCDKSKECYTESGCSSSSSSSEKCCKKECKKSCLNCINPEIIACKKMSAVVSITTINTIVGPTITTPELAGGTANAAGVKTTILTQGTGFFITKDHYILTTAANVLLPPTITSVANRYPFTNKLSVPAIDGSIKNTILKGSRFVVDVKDVNGRENANYTYFAELYAVNGACNFAILKIIDGKNNSANACNPKISECHPYFTFVKDCNDKTKRGSKAYILGDCAMSNYTGINTASTVEAAPYHSGVYSGGSRMITAGIVCDDSYVDHAGWILHDSIVVDACCTPLCSGNPILNCEGKVIGIVAGTLNSIPGGSYTTSTGGFSPSLGGKYGSGLTFGPSERAIKCSLEKLLKKKCDSKKVEVIADNSGSYKSYIKSYLGLAYRVMNGADLDITTDFSSGPSPYGDPREILDANGNQYFPINNACNKKNERKVQGIKILSLAGQTTDNHWFVQGATAVAPFPSLVDSPLVGTINSGDIITQIGNTRVGDLQGQGAPTIYLWEKKPGCKVKIVYKKGGNVSNTVSPNTNSGSNYTFTEETSAITLPMPPMYDYPWYSVQNFPCIYNFGFTLPTIQCPQIPQVASGSIFQPAI